MIQQVTMQTQCKFTVLNANSDADNRLVDQQQTSYRNNIASSANLDARCSMLWCFLLILFAFKAEKFPRELWISQCSFSKFLDVIYQETLWMSDPLLMKNFRFRSECVKRTHTYFSEVPNLNSSRSVKNHRDHNNVQADDRFRPQSLAFSLNHNFFDLFKCVILVVQKFVY